MSRVQYLFDENLSGRIVRGLRRHAPTVSTLTTQEAGLERASDTLILEVAASQNRIVVSHDFRTLRAAAERRLRQDLPMTGLILISQSDPVGRAIDDLTLIADLTTAEEWRGKILFLPL